MVNSGDTINLEDLTRGMNLAVEMPSESNGGEAIQQQAKEGSLLESSSSHDIETLLESPKAPSPIREDETDGLVTGPMPASGVLRDRSANVRPTISPRKVSFPDVLEESGMVENPGKHRSSLESSRSKELSSPIKGRSAMTVPVSPDVPKSSTRVVEICFEMVLIACIGVVLTAQGHRAGEARSGRSGGGIRTQRPRAERQKEECCQSREQATEGK